MNWYLSLTRGKQIAIAVLLAHGLLLAMLSADHWMHRTNTERKKIIVRTMVLEAPTKATSTATSVVTPKSKTSIPASPQTSTAKAEPKKQSAQTASTLPKQEALLLSEIEKNLESLTASPPVVKKSNIAIPAFNASQPQTQTTEYFAIEHIATLLQQTLELPEFGEVKVSLSINRFGLLEKLEILEAKSQKNAEFLKKRLPELQFPCLNEFTTLTIVFSNAL